MTCVSFTSGASISPIEPCEEGGVSVMVALPDQGRCLFTDESVGVAALERRPDDGFSVVYLGDATTEASARFTRGPLGPLGWLTRHPAVTSGLRGVVHANPGRGSRAA